MQHPGAPASPQPDFRALELRALAPLQIFSFKPHTEDGDSVCYQPCDARVMKCTHKSMGQLHVPSSRIIVGGPSDRDSGLWR